MVGNCKVRLPHNRGISSTGNNVEYYRLIRRIRPHEAPRQHTLQQLTDHHQYARAVADQLKLITQCNFYRLRISRQLYSGARPLYRPKQNVITANQVGCIHGRNALKVKGEYIPSSKI